MALLSDNHKKKTKKKPTLIWQSQIIYRSELVYMGVMLLHKSVYLGVEAGAVERQGFLFANRLPYILESVLSAS